MGGGGGGVAMSFHGPEFLAAPLDVGAQVARDWQTPPLQRAAKRSVIIFFVTLVYF